MKVRIGLVACTLLLAWHLLSICGVAEADRVPIIDVHAHLGRFAGFDLSLANLLENMHRFGVQYAFVSNIDGADVPGATANLSEQQANQTAL